MTAEQTVTFTLRLLGNSTALSTRTLACSGLAPKAINTTASLSTAQLSVTPSVLGTAAVSGSTAPAMLPTDTLAVSVAVLLKGLTATTTSTTTATATATTTATVT